MKNKEPEVKLVIARRLDKNGKELPDSKPMVVPIDLRKPETIQQQVARLVTLKMIQTQSNVGKESFDDANDFNIDDDPVEPNTPWEDMGSEKSIAEEQELLDGIRTIKDTSKPKPKPAEKKAEPKPEAKPEAK